MESNYPGTITSARFAVLPQKQRDAQKGKETNGAFHASAVATATRITDQKKSAPATQAHRKGQKRLAIFASVALGACAVIIGGGYAVYFNFFDKSVDKFEAYIQNSDFDKAENLYDRKIDGHEKRENATIDFLEDYLSGINGMYLSEQIDYTEAYQRINAVDELDILSSIKINDASESVENSSYFESICESMQSYIDEKNYADAVAAMDSFHDGDPFYARALSLKQTAMNAKRSELIQDAESAARTNGYEKAIAYLAYYTPAYLADDAQLLAEVDQLKGSLKENLLADAAAEAEAGNYQAAASSLSAGYDVLPDDTDINAKRKEYQDKADEIQKQRDLGYTIVNTTLRDDGVVNENGKPYEATNSNTEITSQGDWLYYIKNKSIYRSSQDLKQQTKLIDFTFYPEGLNVQGAYLYVIDPDGGRIVRVKNDGSDFLVLVDEDTPTNLFVTGDQVYFQLEDWGGSSDGVYCVNTDGTDFKQLISEYVDSYFVKDGSIYYGGKMESGWETSMGSMAVYRYTLSKKETVQMERLYRSSPFFVLHDKILVIDDVGGFSFSIKKDEIIEEFIKRPEEVGNSYAQDNTFIYFFTSDTLVKYNINNNKTTNMKTNDDETDTTSEIVKVGDYIYIQTYNDYDDTVSTLSRMKLDGTGEEQVY
ncbi:MAG: hypothetical protein QM689_12495 [Oscillospiraceae bacterium]